MKEHVFQENNFKTNKKKVYKELLYCVCVHTGKLAMPDV